MLESRILPSNYLDLVFHVNIHLLLDLMTFVHRLPSLLDAHPKVGTISRNMHLSLMLCCFLQISLLVMNSVSFPFHSGQNLSISARTYHLERLKQVLTKACATRNLTVGINHITRRM